MNLSMVAVTGAFLAVVGVVAWVEIRRQMRIESKAREDRVMKAKYDAIMRRLHPQRLSPAHQDAVRAAQERQNKRYPRVTDLGGGSQR